MRHPNSLNRVNALARAIGEAWDLALSGESIRAAIADPAAWGETLGPELVANGGFDSADGWTLGTGWSIAGGAATGGTATTSLSTTNSIGLIAGRTYEVTFTVSAFTSGTVRSNLGGNINGAVRAAAGTYTERLTPAGGDGRLYFVVASFVGSIDNISVREVYTGWLLPGRAGYRLSGASRSGPTMEQQQDGTYRWAPHNLLLNSATLSTQTITVVVGATYTIAATGTGSVTLSGAATGTLNASAARPSLTFVATTTSLTCTVSGSVTLAQINLGPIALPYVPTESAARFAPGVDWLPAQQRWGVQAFGARTNLALWTGDMSNAAWVASGTAAAKVGAATALGAVPMYRINVGSTGGAIGSASSVFQDSISFAAGTTYTVFAIARSVSGASAFRLSAHAEAGAGGVYGSADLSATTTAQVFRFEVTNATGSVHAGNIAIRAATAGGAVGDIEVGGILVVAGSVPASAYSPILTYGAAATRVRDEASVPVQSMTEGAVVGEFVPSLPVGHPENQYMVMLTDGTLNNRFGVFRASGTSQTTFRAVSGGASAAFSNSIVSGQGAVTRVAVAVGPGAGDIVGATNGTLTNAANGVGPFPVNVLRLGDQETGGGLQLNGHILAVRLTSRRPQNGRLPVLTA